MDARRNQMERPTDWPTPGPIDLAVHDLPHASSSTEWWYVNAHLETADGRALSVFASFFQIATGLDAVTKQPIRACSLTWALSDVDGSRYVADSLVDPQAPRLGMEKLEKGEGTADPRLRRAMREILEKNRVPYPDRVLSRPATVAQKRLDLDFDGNTFIKQDDGRYALSLRHPDKRHGVDLVLRLEKPVVRHGNDGVVGGPRGEDMFYYFCPQVSVTGNVVVNGHKMAVTRGRGWYDHEFGGMGKQEPAPAAPPEQAPLRQAAWNWVALQLDDGTEVSAYQLFDLTGTKDQAPPEGWAHLIEEDGSTRSFADMQIDTEGEFVSTRTFNTYPTRYRVRVPDAELELTLNVAFADQELVTVLSAPAFWEGRVTVEGSRAGKKVTGLGYVERSGFSNIDDLDSFFAAVGRETRKSVRAILPLDASADVVMGLIASKEQAHYMDGVDPATFSEHMIAPVREMADRGGKAWRSYAALACCDVVGGDSRRYVRWLAMPELMHTGSLIVDDVQDGSDVRRGGPACHTVYGDAVAINAGTACYFLGQKLLADDEMPMAQRVRIYDLYFEALRAGHGGQALDLAGLDRWMPEVVASGNAADLVKRVLAVHRLKTAAPAAALARMGAVVGNGSEAQIAAVGNFFESLGLAFQIIDDVLNLEGFQGDLKTRAEDIMHGKVTLPVAKAMGLLPQIERARLWKTLASHPTDAAVVGAAVETITGCGALAACKQDAHGLIESAWQRLDPLIEDSLVKLMLRAFGWYVLERHY